MNKMKCYNVTCVDNVGNSYVVGVMASDDLAAKHCAVHSLLEGKHINAKAGSVTETDKI